MAVSLLTIKKNNKKNSKEEEFDSHVDLQWWRSTAMSTVGYTHLRFGVWAGQATSALAVQASGTAWTSSMST